MNRPAHDSCELITGDSLSIAAVVLGGYGLAKRGNGPGDLREKGNRR